MVILMSEQHKPTRKNAKKEQPSLLGDWQSFRALQEAAYRNHGKHTLQANYRYLG